MVIPRTCSPPEKTCIGTVEKYLTLCYRSFTAFLDRLIANGEQSGWQIQWDMDVTGLDARPRQSVIARAEQPDCTCPASRVVVKTLACNLLDGSHALEY